MKKVVTSTVLEIGNDLDNADFSFGKVSHVTPGPDGRIYVLDVLEPDVKVFSKDGRFLRSIGREGQGPGEFTHPLFLHVRDRTVVVTDGMQRKTASFTVDGQHLETRRLPQLHIDRSGFGVIPLRNGISLVVTTPRFSTNPRATDPYTTLIVAGGKTDGDTIARIRSDNANYRITQPGYAFGGANSGFGDGGDWSTSGDSAVVVVDGYTGVLKWFAADSQGLRALREVILPGRAEAGSSADLDRLRRRVLEDQNRLYPRRPAKSIEIIDVPEKWSMVSDAILAEDGSVWVSGPIPPGATTREWTIVPADGRDRRRASLPSQFTPTAIEDSLLYGFSVSEYDTPIVQVFRIAR